MAANKSTNASTSSTDPQTAWGGHVRGRLARPGVKWRMLARPPSGSPQPAKYETVTSRGSPSRPACVQTARAASKLGSTSGRCQPEADVALDPAGHPLQRRRRETTEQHRDLPLSRPEQPRFGPPHEGLALSHEAERLQVAIQAPPGRASRGRARPKSSGPPTQGEAQRQPVAGDAVRPGRSGRAMGPPAMYQRCTKPSVNSGEQQGTTENCKPGLSRQNRPPTRKNASLGCVLITRRS